MVSATRKIKVQHHIVIQTLFEAAELSYRAIKKQPEGKYQQAAVTIKQKRDYLEAVA